MALTTEELIAVVAGSVSGLIVFLIALALILYFCVGKRRKDRKRRGQNSFKHHHLTPDTSLSKNSGLQQGIQPGDPRALADPRMDPRLDPRMDPRLPKVGSSNLWFGTPSMYSAGPSQAYHDMKKKPGDRSQKPPPVHGPLAGHLVYQGGSRIYHSQQAVPSVFEQNYGMSGMARSGSYMDLYSYPYNYDPYRDMNNSRPVVAEYPPNEYYIDPYRERETRRTGKQVRRSQSDVTLHSTRRPKNRKQRGEAPFDRDGKPSSKSRGSETRDSSQSGGKRRSRSSERVLNDDGAYVVRADVHRSKKQAPPPPKPKPSKEEIQSKSMEFSDPEISESATDSAKLRAIERERYRNAAIAKINSNNSEYVIGKDNPGYTEDEVIITEDLNVRPYSYEGRPSKYENAIVAKMANMSDTPKATHIARQSINDSESMPPTKQAFHEQVTKKLERLQDTTPKPVDIDEGPVATSTGKHSRASRPTSAKGRRSRRDSNVTDQDGNVITTEAFEFLEGYSDGEGTDFLNSGNITPTQMRDFDVEF